MNRYVYRAILNTVFSLIFFSALSQEKKKPVFEYRPSTLTNSTVGCSVFTSPTNYTCASSFNFEAPTNNNTYTLPASANTGCLFSTPNQTWFVVTVTSLVSNTLTFTQSNSNDRDVDAAIWGPIQNNNLANACAATQNEPLSCDYSAASISSLSIGNVAVGNRYVILVTNYSNAATNINIPQPQGGTVQYCKADGLCAVPTATIFGSQSINPGDFAVLSIAFTGESPWTYSVDNGFGTNLTTTNNPASIAVNPTNTTTYNVISVSNNCAVGSTNGSAVVTVNDPCGQNKAVTLSGSKSIIEGEATTLTLTSSSILPYNYEITNIGTGTATTNPYEISITPNQTQSFRLVSASNGCDIITANGGATVVTQLPTTTKKLVSCFPFDGNAVDEKGLNTAIPFGVTPTEDRFGNPNGAYNFTANGRIDISSNELINNEFTWTFWAKPITLPLPGNTQALISLGGRGGDQTFGINNNSFTNTGNKPRWILGNYVGFETVGPFETVDEIINENEWYFIAAVRSRDSLSVYVNGDLKSKIYSGGDFPYYGTTGGRISSRSYTQGQHFKGALDDIKFFKSTLTKEEIKLLYYTNSCDFEYLENRKVELVSCYPFDGNANDEVNTNNGNLIGATLVNDRFGQPNKAYLFDGNDRISLPNESFRNNSYSVSAWVKPSNNGSSSGGAIFAIGGTGGEQTISWVNDQSSSYTPAFRFLSNTYYFSGSNTPILTANNQTANQWYHVVAIREPHRIKLYINGIFVGEESTNNYTNAYYGLDPSITATIGGRDSNQPFYGVIDDVKIFNGALYDAEVKALFNEIRSGCNYETCVPYKFVDQQLNNRSIVNSGKITEAFNLISPNTTNSFFSGGSIVLLPGFKADNNSIFKAEIKGCKDNQAEPEIDLTAAKRALVSCFPFNGNANDSQGLNNGNVIGATLTEDRFGNAESAYSFDGDDRIEMSTNQLINNEFTWSAWVKPNSLPRPGNTQALIGLGGFRGDQTFGINNNSFTDTNNEPRWILGNYIGFDNVGPYETVNDRIIEGIWYHITVVRTIDSLSVFVNGRIKSKIYSGGSPPFYGNDTRIGRIGSRWTNMQNYIGVLDDIIFFDRALNEEEVYGIFLTENCELE